MLSNRFGRRSKRMRKMATPYMHFVEGENAKPKFGSKEVNVAIRESKCLTLVLFRSAWA